MARRGSRWSGAGSASPTTNSAAPASKGVWKMLAGGLLVLIFLSWLLPGGSISSLFWGFLIALILGTILIFGLIYTVGGKKLPSTPTGFWAALKNYKKPILWVTAFIWLFGFSGLIKLIDDPWGFGGDGLTAVKETFTPANKQELVSVQNGKIRYEYMLDFSQDTLSRAKIKVSDYVICEQGLRLYEAGKTVEAKQFGVFEDGYAAQDGTVVLASALICEHGPDSRNTVIWRGDAEHIAYESFWRQRTAVGLTCTPKAGWQCLMTLPVDPSNLANATPYKVETPAYKGCISWDTPADVLVLRDSVMHGIPQWVMWTGSEAARNMGFAHLPNDEPKAVYYKFGAC